MGKEIRTTMGMQIHGYPNLFTTGAPLAPSAALCNMTTCLQEQVEWISDCIASSASRRQKRHRAKQGDAGAWVEHHDETG